MSKTRWFDRNGVELHEGNTIMDILNGELEKVYACHPADDPDNESLGINASNEDWIARHPDRSREVYPFSNFAYKMVDGQRHLTFYEKVV